MGIGKGSDDEDGDSEGDGEEDSKGDIQEEETDSRFHRQQSKFLKASVCNFT